jgi:hypothetical protein
MIDGFWHKNPMIDGFWHGKNRGSMVFGMGKTEDRWFLASCARLCFLRVVLLQVSGMVFVLSFRCYFFQPISKSDRFFSFLVSFSGPLLLPHTLNDRWRFDPTSKAISINPTCMFFFYFFQDFYDSPSYFLLFFCLVFSAS